MTAPSQQKKVLVVDDSPLIRRLVQASLSARGWEVVEAEDGEQGLALAFADPPGAVVLDRQMPNVDGFEVARRLRERAETRQVPILMLAEDAGGDAAVAEAVDEYMPKPFQPDELDAALERIVAARSGGDSRGAAG